MREIKNVAIYCRTSLIKSDISRQVFELKALAEFNKWQIVEVYTDEGFSRTTSRRPGLDRLIQDAVTRKFDTVLTLELSRLGSSLKHLIDVVDFFKKHNINLFIKNQNIDTSTITGYFFFSILTSVSQFEKDLLSERVKSKLQMLKQKGIKLGRPTKVNDALKQKVIELDKSGVSYNKIAKQLKIGVQTACKILKEEDSKLCSKVAKKFADTTLNY